MNDRSSHPEVFFGKGVLKICSKVTGEHTCRSVISLQHGCSPVNLLHIFRTTFLKNTSRWLLLEWQSWKAKQPVGHYLLQYPMWRLKFIMLLARTIFSPSGWLKKSKLESSKFYLALQYLSNIFWKVSGTKSDKVCVLPSIVTMKWIIEL